MWLRYKSWNTFFSLYHAVSRQYIHSTRGLERCLQMRIMFWNCAIEKEQDISKALKERKWVLSQIALGYLLFLFLRRVKGSRNEKSFQSISLAAQWTFISENNDWDPLPWSFFTQCHKNRSHSYIAPNANSRPEIDNTKEPRTSHTWLTSLEDFSPIITLKLAVFINRERDIHLYLGVTSYILDTV